MLLKTKIKIIVSLFIVIVLFGIVSFLVKSNITFFKILIENNFSLGIFLFIFLEILSIVIAPITSLPLIPIASNTYGVFLTSIFFVIGGFFGSLIAFFIGKKLRKRAIGKVISLEDVKLIGNAIPKKYHFLALLLMRIVVPADILSYTLGITTSISNRLFIATTLIGIIPSAIFFSYLGTFSLTFQFIGWTIGIIVLIAFLYLLFRKKNIIRN